MSSFSKKFNYKNYGFIEKENNSLDFQHFDKTQLLNNLSNKQKIPSFLHQKRTNFSKEDNKMKQNNPNSYKTKFTTNIQNMNPFLKNITNTHSSPLKFNDSIKSRQIQNQTLIQKIQRIDSLYDKIKSKSKLKNYYQNTSPKTSFKKRESMFDSKTSLLQFNNQYKSKDLFVQNNQNQFDLLRSSDKTYERKNSYLDDKNHLKKFTYRHSISTSNISSFELFSSKVSQFEFSKSFYSDQKDSKFNFSLRASKVQKINELKLNFQEEKIQQLKMIQNLTIEPLSVKIKDSCQIQAQTQNQQTARFNFQQIPNNQKQNNQLNVKSFNAQVKNKLSVSNFIIGPCKGQGRFGKVYMAIQKVSKFIVALKVIKKQSLSYMFDQFIQQIKLQMFLNHPYIAKLYGCFSEGDFFYIIMEYMQEGSLFTNLKKKKMFSQQQSVIKLTEIALGLQQMHKFNIIHRDLKPQNIVMSFNVCKICDFGWAAYCKTRRQTNCGTLDYLCPQVIQGQSYSFSVDLWGLGVLLYQMLIGKPPFYNISRKQTIKKIKDCSFVIPNHLSSQSKQIIQCLLKKDPQERLTITSILELNFFKNNMKNEEK